MISVFSVAGAVAIVAVVIVAVVIFAVVVFEVVSLVIVVVVCTGDSRWSADYVQER